MFSKSIYGFSMLESEKSLSIFRSIIMMMACDIFSFQNSFFFNYTFLNSTPDIYSSKKCGFSCSTHFKAIDSTKTNPVIPKSLANDASFTCDFISQKIWKNCRSNSGLSTALKTFQLQSVFSNMNEKLSILGFRT